MTQGRSTQIFLSTGSYTATAERMVLHKNSVLYRIRKAEEALGAPIGDRRADLELALRACQYLGHAVLLSAGERGRPQAAPARSSTSFRREAANTATRS